MNQQPQIPIKTFALATISLALVMGLSACGEGETGNSGGGGTLTIQSTNPPQGSMSQGLKPTISVTLAETVDQNSITNAVHLMPAPPEDGDHDMNMNVDDSDMMSEVIAGIANVSGNTITFTPSQPLSPGTKYHFHVSGVRLANGQQLKTGTDVVQFFFTTPHAHEATREYYTESSGGQSVCTRQTTVMNNERVMRSYNGVPGSTLEEGSGCSSVSGTVRRTLEYPGATLPVTVHYKSVAAGHNPVVNGVPVLQYTEWGTASVAMNGNPANATVYTQELPANSNGVQEVRYKKDINTGQFLATDWWSTVEQHATHQITYSYEATNGTGVANFNPANAKNPQEFVLDDASLMEMNHNLTVPTNGMYPHRHIFFRSLGDNGILDYITTGQVGDDLITAYHTREYDTQGRRTKDWTWKGNSSRQGPNGNTVYFDHNRDIATRVRVYKFDPNSGARVARISYESASGKSYADWQTFLSQAASNPTYTDGDVSLHDARVYNLNPTTYNIQSVDDYHECSNTFACQTPINISVAGEAPIQITGMYKRSSRIYSTN